MHTYDDAFVERFMAPWNAHDVDGAMMLMTDGCVWEVTKGPEPIGARFAGAGAVRGAIAALFERMPDIRYELVHSSFGPDLVVLELLVIGTPAGSMTTRFHACDVMTMRDGRVAAKRSYRKVVE